MLGQYKGQLMRYFGANLDDHDDPADMTSESTPSFVVIEKDDLLSQSLASRSSIRQRDKNSSALLNHLNNPFIVMSQWITLEILDLEAILQAIDKSAEM